MEITAQELSEAVSKGIAAAFAPDVLKHTLGCPLEQARVSTIEREQEELKKFVEGNGKAGAKLDIERLKQEQKVIKENLDAFKKNLNYGLWLIGAILITSLINLVIK